MPGFIGVRYGELVPVTPDDKSPDVYVYFEGNFGIITLEEEVVVRTMPPPGSVDDPWSHSNVKHVRAMAFNGETNDLYTSLDAGKTWSLTIGSQPDVQFAMLFDEFYALDAGSITIRVTRTQGTTYFDVGSAPSGTSISSVLRGSDAWIYGNVTPQE
jgi:hypothetical protein